MFALDDWSSWIITAGAVGAVLMGFFRVVWPKWRRFTTKVGGVADAILGRDAIFDRITHKELVPALPGLGVRQAKQEEQMELLTVTVTKLVDQRDYLQALTRVVDGHGDRLDALEEATLERVTSHVESAHMFKAMDTAMKSTPPDADAE